MPTLMLRGLSADLVARVRAYAHGRGLSLPETVAALLTSALDGAEAQRVRATAMQAARTPEARQEAARAGARARWGQRDHP